MAIVVDLESILVTAASLRSQTSKDLAQMAKNKGVPGWHSMRKEQLVHALVKIAKQKAKSNQKTVASHKGVAKTKSAPKNNSRVARKIRQERMQVEIYRRNGEYWDLIQYGANEEVRFDSIDFVLGIGKGCYVDCSCTPL